MFVHVTDGPEPELAILAFLSKTSVDRFCAACAIFSPPCAPSAGVSVPVVGRRGVVAPEFACVARTDAVASFLEFSERSCLTFLLRRCEGRQVEERKGRGIWAMSRVSRSFW